MEVTTSNLFQTGNSTVSCEFLCRSVEELNNLFSAIINSQLMETISVPFL